VTRALERYHLRRENQRYRVNLERMVLEQTQEIRRTRDAALMTLAKLAESRDNQTGMHLERIAAFSHRLGQELRQGTYRGRVSRAFLHQLHRSSPLHDIGKVGIPDSILRKPAPLTPSEFAIMKRHTTIGGDTLRSGIDRANHSSFLIMAMEIAYSHHERWDGRGYPAGLRGTQIPLAARIVAVADSYDAMTSERPYKGALSHAEATRRIVADRDAHFDPVIVDAFVRSRVEFDRIRDALGSSELSDSPVGQSESAHRYG
jgi:putative two-component system response regulator